VSVDTSLRGKDTSSYQPVIYDDVEVLVAPSMARVTDQIHVDTRGAWFWRGFVVTVEHEHGPACHH
jgi:hypothetical protein